MTITTDSNFLNETVFIEEPSEDEFVFQPGQTKQLIYKIQNKEPHKITDIMVTSKTVIKTGVDSEGKPVFEPTTAAYSNISHKPKSISPFGKATVKVNVVVPASYKETIFMKDGTEVIQPFRVQLNVKAIRHIEEI